MYTSGGLCRINYFVFASHIFWGRLVQKERKSGFKPCGCCLEAWAIFYIPHYIVNVVIDSGRYICAIFIKGTTHCTGLNASQRSQDGICVNREGWGQRGWGAEGGGAEGVRGRQWCVEPLGQTLGLSQIKNLWFVHDLLVGRRIRVNTFWVWEADHLWYILPNVK